MKLRGLFTMNRVAVGCLCAGALAAVACANGGVSPTSPSAMSTVPNLAATAPGDTAKVLASSPRTGALRVTKECGGFTGQAGSFCTITSSNLKAIEVGSRIVYLQPADVGTPSGSDVVLDVPGPGNNTASGHCSTAVGVCTFSGGTGKFTSFQASVDVTHTDDYSLWYWDGTYSFDPRD